MRRMVSWVAVTPAQIEHEHTCGQIPRLRSSMFEQAFMDEIAALDAQVLQTIRGLL